MKNFVASLFVVIIGGIFVWYYTNNEPKVVYSISDGIIFPSPNNEENVYQQILVKNIGDAEASSVSLRVNGDISRYSIEKNSSADIVMCQQNKNFLDCRYDKLQINASFTLTIQTKTKISANDVSITLSNGIATNAFDKNDFVDIGIVYICFTAILFITTFRFYSIEWWVSKSIKTSASSLLKMKKPFFISEKRWRDVLKTAVFSAMNEKIGLYGKLGKQFVYNLLNGLYSSALPDDLFHEMREVAVDMLKFSMEYRALRKMDSKADVLLIEKPKFVNEAEWKDIHEEVGQILCLNVQREICSGYINKGSVSEFINTANISERQRDEIRKIFEKFIFCDCARKILSWKSVVTVKPDELSFLNPDDATILLKIEYNAKLYNLLELFSGQNFREKIEAADWLEAKDSVYLLDLISSFESIRKSTEAIEIKQVELERLLKDVKEKKEMAESALSDVSLLKKDTLRKLDIINSVLENSREAFRIEDFDVFSKVNIENLKKIASILEYK